MLQERDHRDFKKADVANDVDEVSATSSILEQSAPENKLRVTKQNSSARHVSFVQDLPRVSPKSRFNTE